MAHLKDLDLLPDGLVAVLGVGSTARGWGNESSDLNFYVISAEPWTRAGVPAKSAPLVPSAVPVTTARVDGTRWKLKHWSEGQVAQMLAKVTWERFTARTGDASPLTEIEELFLERLESAVPVVGGDWLAARRDQAAASAFRAFSSLGSTRAAERSSRDALDRLRADDPHGAVLTARQAFGHAVDAYLDSRGNHGTFTPKWRARRVAETPPACLPFDRYWALETAARLDPDRPAAWVHEVVDACAALLAETGTPSAPAR
ncbi:hypothetical protein AB0K51_04500 [Kitasatospora sp. NPDC049285]|uniref:hypothetical protein n=1 Tax=Kitasatospora sp. NPDC049285 TaxID=3157096 RepID=UPI00342C7552